MLINKTNKFLDVKYFMDLGLHLGNRVQNRAVWLQGFILGSRGKSWEILNVQEVLKSLEKLGPILVHIVKNGGTILVINRVLEKEIFYLNKIFKLNPFCNVIRVFTDEWIDGAFSNFSNFKFLNLRQLPSLVFLSDFTDSSNLLDEAYFLRIPVVGLVDSRLHQDVIMKRVMMPIPSNNSIRSLFFFFNFLKYYVEKGLYLSDYSLVKDEVFNNFKNFKDLNHINMVKKDNFISTMLKKRNFMFLTEHYLKKASFIDKTIDYVNMTEKDKKEDNKKIFEDLNNIKDRHLNMKYLVRLNAKAVYNRGSIQRFKGVLKHTSLQVEEKYSIDKKFFTRYNTPFNWKNLLKFKKDRRIYHLNSKRELKKSKLWNNIYEKYIN